MNIKRTDPPFKWTSFRGAGQAGSLRERAGQPCFAHTAGSGEDQVTFIGNPFACQKLLEQRLVEAAPGAVVDIFGAGANMAQAGRAHAALKPFGLATGGLPINEQTQPFGVAEIGGAVLWFQFSESLGHAVKL